MEVANEKLIMWAYAAVIPFHKFSMHEFNIACEAIGKYGRGFTGPNEYQLLVPILKQDYAMVSEKLEKRESWE